MFFFNLLTLGVMHACGGQTGRATLLGFDSVPANPVAGDNVSTWIAYSFSSPAITGGTATYAYSLNGLPFPSSTYDLCTQTVCPKEPGIYNETSSAIFPSGVSGKIVSSITWKDQNGELVWCVETTWKV